jgi:Flp pilus assembly protein TadG
VRGARRAIAGQALVEFTLTISVFLIALLGAVSAGIYTVQRSAAVGAVSASVRIAAGGVDAPNGLGDDPASRRTARQAALRRALQMLQPAMVGNMVTARDGDCRRDQQAPGRIEICAFDDGDAPDSVTVVVTGTTSLIIPRYLGFLAGVPITVHATIHRLTFSA